MNSSRITEILHQKLSEVNSTGSLLGLTRYTGESDDLWRDRVAYAMQAKLYAAENKPISDKLKARMAEVEERAKSSK